MTELVQGHLLCPDPVYDLFESLQSRHGQIGAMGSPSSSREDVRFRGARDGEGMRNAASEAGKELGNQISTKGEKTVAANDLAQAKGKKASLKPGK